MIEIKETQQLDKILQENPAVVLDFYAPWCAPCRQLLPVLEGMSNENEDVVFCKINVDENIDIAKKYVVRSIPTVKYIKHGEIVDTSMGMQPKQNILEHLEKLK